MKGGLSELGKEDPGADAGELDNVSQLEGHDAGQQILAIGDDCALAVDGAVEVDSREVGECFVGIHVVGGGHNWPCIGGILSTTSL